MRGRWFLDTLWPSIDVLLNLSWGWIDLEEVEVQSGLLLTWCLVVFINIIFWLRLIHDTLVSAWWGVELYLILWKEVSSLHHIISPALLVSFVVFECPQRRLLLYLVKMRLISGMMRILYFDSIQLQLRNVHYVRFLNFYILLTHLLHNDLVNIECHWLILLVLTSFFIFWTSPFRRFWRCFLILLYNLVNFSCIG